MFIIGSIEELGRWKNWSAPACKMEWTEGHVWKTQDIVIKNTSRFQYKYILKDQDDNLIWDNGINRIADLKLKTEEIQANHKLR